LVTLTDLKTRRAGLSASAELVFGVRENRVKSDHTTDFTTFFSRTQRSKTII